MTIKGKGQWGVGGEGVGKPRKNPYMKSSREKHGYSRNKQKKSHASFNQHIPDSTKIALGLGRKTSLASLFLWSFS